MKAVIQLVKSASVNIDGAEFSKIGKGYFILLGVEENDTSDDARIMAQKVAKLRVFKDDNDKMNLSVIDVGGEILVVSQFTLCADVKKGNRPSFAKAMEPKTANEIYLNFVELLREQGVAKVATGSFGADMLCDIQNDGPVTICYDTSVWIDKGECND